MTDPDTSAWTPAAPQRQVVVWPHTLGEHERYDDAVAVMQPGGALLIWRWGYDASRGDVPIRGYAPGAWVTFDHVGDGYTTPAPRQVPVEPVQKPSDEAHAAPAVDENGDPLPRSHEHDPDPFEQLDPENLDREHAQAVRRTRRRPRTGEIVAPDADGEDAAFRESADSRPLDGGDTDGQVRSEPGAGGVAQVVAGVLSVLAGWGRRAVAASQRLWRRTARSIWPETSSLPDSVRLTWPASLYAVLVLSGFVLIPWLAFSS